MDGSLLGYTALTQGSLESTLHRGNVDRFAPFPGKNHAVALVMRQNFRNCVKVGSDNGTLRSLPPLLLRTQSRHRSPSISSTLRWAASETRRPHE